MLDVNARCSIVKLFISLLRNIKQEASLGYVTANG